MRDERRTLLIYLTAALMIVGFLALHTVHFHGRNYRQDEIITAHASTFRSPAEVVQWMATDIHPPLWRVTAVVWAQQFGQAEPITRFLSTLFTALTLALVYRLAAALFGIRVGLLALFALGSLAFFQFYSHEFRPYPALMTFAAASQLALLRWIRQPTFKHALLYVLAGIGAIYTHYFGLFVLLGQALTFLALVRWDARRYLRAVGLFLAVGLSYLGWLPAFLNVLLISRPEGVTYATESSYSGLVYLHNVMQLRPYGLGAFLLLGALVVPIPKRAAPPLSPFRFGEAWRKLYVAIFAASIFLVVFAVNTRYGILTERNLTIIIPALAVLAGLGLALLPRRLGLVAGILILIPALFDPVSIEPNAPYSEVLASVRPMYAPGDRLVFNLGNLARQNLVFRDYLADRLPIADPTGETYLVSDSQTPENDAAALRDEFSAFLDESAQVWYVESPDMQRLGGFYREIIERDYLLIQAWDFESPTYQHPHQLSLYRRIPEPENPIQVGDVVALFHWTLQADVNVQPCQTVSVESWWRADVPIERSYSMTLVLADSSGVGVTRSDSAPAGVLTPQWQPEQVYRDVREVQVPCDAAPGDYLLLVGWYDFETLEVLPAGAHGSGLAYLTTLHVQ